MSNVLSTNRGRMLAVGALIALIVAALFATQASSPSEATAAKRSTHVSTILIRGIARENQFPRLVFDGPATVGRGDILRVRSLTDGRKVGPHTFSLVPDRLHPDTKAERKNCFTPNDICFEIAQWHKAGPQGPPGVTLVRTGRPGWDTEGNLKRKGDSWYTGVRRGNTRDQVVTAPVGSTLSFMCAIHPHMHGEIRVTR